MKKKLLLSIAIAMYFYLGSAYAQKLAFTYDASGNQITRTWVCVNCRTPSEMESVTTNADPVNKVTDSISTKEIRSVVASPNPLVEILNVDWKTEKGISVSYITVFNSNGTKVHEISVNPSQQSVQIPFLHLPSGVYILSVTFSDQRQENIKVIKR